jgi:hypothetical protein
LYDAWGKPEDAKKNWEESKKMYEKVLGPNAPEIKEVQDLLDGKKPVNPDNAVIQENPEDMHVPEL